MYTITSQKNNPHKGGKKKEIIPTGIIDAIIQPMIVWCSFISQSMSLNDIMSINLSTYE